MQGISGLTAFSIVEQNSFRLEVVSLGLMLVIEWLKSDLSSICTYIPELQLQFPVVTNLHICLLWSDRMASTCTEPVYPSTRRCDGTKHKEQDANLYLCVPLF